MIQFPIVRALVLTMFHRRLLAEVKEAYNDALLAKSNPPLYSANLDDMVALTIANAVL